MTPDYWELIHNRFVLPPTATSSGTSKEQQPGPVYMQQHGNPVRYRNIWVVEIPRFDCLSERRKHLAKDEHLPVLGYRAHPTLKVLKS